ncbi:uncharacterized protein LOC135131344 [Zophobas morio]
MNPFAVIFAICCLASARARPTYGHGGTSQLEGVPNDSHYGKLTYPHYDILELGSEIKGSLPPAVVEITKKVVIKEPKPYPVKVPVPVPHPVEVAKPYPVVETKIIKVPHPVPVEVIKKIPVPFEVPKPFPVPSEEFKAPHLQAPVSSYGGSFSGHDQFGHQQAAEVHEESQDGGGYSGGYDGGYGGGYEGGSDGGSDGGYGGGFEGGDNGGSYASADQSQSYGSHVQPEQYGWVPVQMIHDAGEAQQIEEHQQ